MGLSLFLLLEEQKVKPGNLPDATLRLINDGSDVIIINTRMLLVPKNYPDRKKEISFSITGPPGSINTRKFRVNAGVAGPDKFVRLFPGEYILKDYALNKYFSFSKPGDYVVQAVYENHLVFTLDSLKSWTGSVKSNEQTFKIIE